MTVMLIFDVYRIRAMEGLINSEVMYKQTGQKPQMMPYVCGQCCCCQCCGCKQVSVWLYQLEADVIRPALKIFLLWHD